MAVNEQQDGRKHFHTCVGIERSRRSSLQTIPALFRLTHNQMDVAKTITARTTPVTNSLLTLATCFVVNCYSTDYPGTYLAIQSP